MTDEKPEPDEKPKRPSRRVMMIAGGAAFLILVALVAILRPGRQVAATPHGDAENEDAVGRLDPTGPSVPGALEAPASRPAAARDLAKLCEADSAYDSGDFGKARSLYLDLLLAGGDLGGEEVARWAYGRFALCLARLARGPEDRLIDDPPLLFQDVAR